MCHRCFSTTYRWTISTAKWYNFKVCYPLLFKFWSTVYLWYNLSGISWKCFTPFHPNPSTPTLSASHDPYIFSNPKFNPFFENAIDAIDGTHFISSGTAEERAIARDRKGLVTQNCLAACNFDHNFTYISTGWEGSVSDSTMYIDSRTTDLKVQPGKYYLADAGFPLASALLTFYWGVWYHLAEWGRADLRYVANF